MLLHIGLQLVHGHNSLGLSVHLCHYVIKLLVDHRLNRVGIMCQVLWVEFSVATPNQPEKLPLQQPLPFVTDRPCTQVPWALLYILLDHALLLQEFIHNLCVGTVRPFQRRHFMLLFLDELRVIGPGWQDFPSTFGPLLRCRRGVRHLRPAMAAHPQNSSCGLDLLVFKPLESAFLLLLQQLGQLVPPLPWCRLIALPNRGGSYRQGAALVQWRCRHGVRLVCLAVDSFVLPLQDGRDRGNPFRGCHRCARQELRAGRDHILVERLPSLLPNCRL
mmetsp:Transcript_10101/g.17873  ORF Transcript_10101/g.17873 Transcript_10101/m.17873 type:complete len:275 (-) Transcript_10101:244-1068(-)